VTLVLDGKRVIFIVVGVTVHPLASHAALRFIFICKTCKPKA